MPVMQALTDSVKHRDVRVHDKRNSKKSCESNNGKVGEGTMYC